MQYSCTYHKGPYFFFCYNDLLKQKSIILVCFDHSAGILLLRKAER